MISSVSVANSKSPAHQDDSCAAPQVYRSLGFGLIANHLKEKLKEQSKPSVLDLGPSVSANITYLSQYHCKLYVENLSDSVDDLNAAMRAKEDRDRAIGACFQPYGNSQFDVILAWDLFNYLDLEALATSMDYLSRYCKPGTRLYALVGIGKQVLDTPSRFEIVDDEQLRYGVAMAGGRCCPQHSIPDLLRRLPEFAVKRTYLLRNGMQEYVFGYQTY
jgi:hypothetical protein